MFCHKCKSNEFTEIFVCQSCNTIYNSIKEPKPIKTKTPLRTINNKRGTSSMLKPSTQIQLKPSPKPVITTAKSEVNTPKRTTTAEIHSQSTSPTLVEFQNRNAELPDWRLHLKNAVQQRLGKSSGNIEHENVSSIGVSTLETTYPVSGGNALKAEIFEEKQLDNETMKQLNSALNRIELSRQRYYISEQPEEIVEIPEVEKPIVKDYPFKIAARNENPVAENNVELKTSVNFPNKPTLVPKNKTSKSKSLYDTSELDPNFIPAKVSSSFENRSVSQKLPKPTIKEKVAETKVEEAKEISKSNAVEANELDELAPFTLRFNSGIFDLIIGSLCTMILLSPFVLLGGSWFSVAGIFAFVATCAIVMFIYLTTTIGLFGKTFGMHLFGLEMIDNNSDEYPTFHQSAVSSSIYLLSIAFFGLGFVTTIFDENKRAVHDLVSGTIIVKEI